MTGLVMLRLWMHRNTSFLLLLSRCAQNMLCSMACGHQVAFHRGSETTLSGSHGIHVSPGWEGSRGEHLGASDSLD